MLTETKLRAADTSRFGPFALHSAARRLENAGVPVALGGRALDILIILVNHAGEIVSHQALLAQVWPDVTVDPSSLRVQMRALRKALGVTGEGRGYIINVAGRGYSFVATVARGPAVPLRPPTGAEFMLPKQVPLIGREQALSDVVAELMQTRFVTIAGTGGVGKTALAIAAAHALAPAFAGAVYFLDLSDVTSPYAAHVMLGRAALRRSVMAEGAVQGLSESLRGKHALIVLDCCDHIASAMGELASSLMRQTRDVHVLATSRTPLSGEGETIIALPPLPIPADFDTMPAQSLADIASVRMLVERVQLLSRETAHGADIRAMARIAQRLDGLPLALELAAASIAQNGVAQAASMIESRFVLFMSNPAASLPRHASLNAAMEWSYVQLTPEQRTIFRNISVFAGPFTMDGIRHVGADADMDAAALIAGARALLAKSILFRETGEDAVRYRMLDTTRAFGLSKLLMCGEGETAKGRHALYITEYLTRANAASPGPSAGRVVEGLTCHIHNITAALQWCFSQYGDAMLGARLAAASAHVFATLWLHDESIAWSKQALSRLDPRCLGTQLELDIRTGILMNIVGADAVPAMAAQLPAIIALADACGSSVWRAEARALDCLMMAQQRPIGETVDCARAVREITRYSDDTPSRLLGDWLLGLACHLRGDLPQVEALCASAATLAFGTDSIYFSSTQASAQIGAIGSLARTLWLRGQPDQALHLARATLAKLEGDIGYRRHVPVFFLPLFVWAGAFEDAENLLAVARQDEAHDTFVAFGQLFQGGLSMRRGDIPRAVASLQYACDKLATAAERGIAAAELAEALAVQGRFLAARRAIEGAFLAHEELGESFFTPEVYRIMGMIMAIGPASEVPQAEGWFVRAIDCALRQDSLSFALRAATCLAAFQRNQGSADHAASELATIYGRFTEGHATPDLVAARNLLDTLRAPAGVAVPG